MAGLSPWAPHAAPCPGRPGPAGLTLLLAGLRGSQAAGRAGRSQAPGRAADGGVVGVSPWALTLVGGTCVCTERGSRGPRGHEQPLPPPTCQLGTSTPGPLGRHPRSLRGRCPTPGPQPTHSHPLPFSTQKLEQEREHVGGDPEDPRVTPGGEDRPDAALLGALGRRRDLLRTLREQRLLEEASQAPARSRPPPPATPPLGVYPAAPLPPRAPEPPWLIQPWALQPLAAAVQPPPQAGPPPRGPGGIKEDMVEMMLMQNAQLHQILMHSLMLRALPSSVFSPLGASQAAPLHPGLQRPRAPSVHHHHHYAPPAPGSLPACPPWTALLATLPPAPGLLPALHPLAGPAAAGSP
eukprot:XP_022269041.1 uncharacterized protein C21orf58 homolog isoform X2 [Canis lupus familiaris]